MNTQRRLAAYDQYEIVLPFGGGGAEELLDECPLCETLRRRIAEGVVTDVPLQIEIEDEKLR